MTPNDLIKLMDKGYAQDSGLVAKNWTSLSEESGQATASPVDDALAHYLATWVSDRVLGSWFTPGKEKPDLEVLAELSIELVYAINDLSDLIALVERVAVYESAIKFFERLSRNPRSVDTDLIYCWNDSSVSGLALDQDEVEPLIMGKLGKDAENPTAEVCEKILAGLREEKAALLG